MSNAFTFFSSSWNWSRRVFLSLFLCTTSLLSAEKYDLVVCALFHNEELFMKEWIEFHKLVGVQHFYLYNHLSTDRSLKILEPYINAGEVELFHVPTIVESQHDYLGLLQIPVYNQALERVRGEAHWAAFIDLDEFLFPMKGLSLADLLNDYEEFAGVAANWQIYGTSGVDVVPKDGLIIENLVWKGDETNDVNRMFKLIVQPSRIREVDHPHYFQCHDGYFIVDGMKRPVIDAIETESVCVGELRINHYWFGTSRWYQEQKVPRRLKWGIYFSPEQERGTIEAFNHIRDDSALKYAAILKTKMRD